MDDKLERLIKMAYKKWKSGQLEDFSEHPDEEELACFIEGRLSEKENESLTLHVLKCERCAEIIFTQAVLNVSEVPEVPQEVILSVKNLAGSREKHSFLEIILRLKDEMLEVLNTNGDILVGRELVPAPVLRSRQIKDFKGQVVILRDFKNVRIEAKIENKGAKVFNLNIIAREKQTNNPIRSLRVTLLRDNLELESYLTDSGSVTFEHVLLGKYSVEVTALENRLATLILDIR